MDMAVCAAIAKIGLEDADSLLPLVSQQQRLDSHGMKLFWKYSLQLSTPQHEVKTATIIKHGHSYIN